MDIKKKINNPLDYGLQGKSNFPLRDLWDFAFETNGGFEVSWADIGHFLVGFLEFFFTEIDIIIEAWFHLFERCYQYCGIEVLALILPQIFTLSYYFPSFSFDFARSTCLLGIDVLVMFVGILGCADSVFEIREEQKG